MRGRHGHGTATVWLIGLCGLLAAACIPPPSHPGPTTTTTAAPDPLRITTASLPAGIVGRPYVVTLTRSGGSGPVTWSTGTPLPADFTLSSDGVLSGLAGQEVELELDVVVRDARAALASVRLHLAVHSAGTGPLPTEVPKVHGNLQWGSLRAGPPGSLPRWFGYQTSEATGDTAALATRQVAGSTTFVGHADPGAGADGVDHAAVDPTGRYVAVSPFPLLTSSALDVVDTFTGSVVYSSPPPTGVTGAGQEGAFSPDGRYLAVLRTVAGFGGVVDFVDTSTWTVARTTGTGGEPGLQGAGGFGSTRIGIVWSPDSTRIAMPTRWSTLPSGPVPPMVVLAVASTGATTVGDSAGCFPQDWAATDRILAICYGSADVERIVEARTYPAPTPGATERYHRILAGRQCSNSAVCAPSTDQLPTQGLLSPDGSQVVLATSNQLDAGLGFDIPVILQGAPDADQPRIDQLTEPLTALRLLGWTDAAHPWATS